MRLPPYMLTSDSQSSSEDSSEDDSSDEGSNYGKGLGGRYGQYGVYGRNVEGQDRYASELREAREYRRQRKAERKRHHKAASKKKDMTHKYTLYMSYVPAKDRDYVQNSGHQYGM